MCTNLCTLELETSPEMCKAKDQMLMISSDVGAEVSHSCKCSSGVAMSANEGQIDYRVFLASRLILRDGLGLEM